MSVFCCYVFCMKICYFLLRQRIVFDKAFHWWNNCYCHLNFQASELNFCIIINNICLLHDSLWTAHKNRFYIWIIGLPEKHKMLWSKIHAFCRRYFAFLRMHRLNNVFPNYACVTGFSYITDVKLSRILLVLFLRIQNPHSCVQAKCRGTLCLY